ncbi:MAG TPA: hypothetical protein VF168_09830 [Trueperaceae bacterium]
MGKRFLYDGEVYVVSARTEDDPARYRLLASRTGGARFVWAHESQLSPMESYLEPDDDTARY